MPWTEKSEGVFRRPFEEYETFIYSISLAGQPHREQWALHSQASFHLGGSIQLRNSELEGHLRRAWTQLRFRHPSIAAHVVNGELQYEVPNRTYLTRWLEETFIVASDHRNTGDIIADRKPTTFAVMNYLPNTSQIVLQTSHWRTDGIGILQIMDTYFNLVCLCAAAKAQVPSWGEEPPNLNLSVEEVARITDDPSPEIKAIAQEATNTLGFISGAIGLEYQGQLETPPGKPRVEHLKFSLSETKTVIEASKLLKVSVTSIAHASITKANYAFAKETDQSKPYTSTIRFGLRPYLPEPHLPDYYCSGIYTTGYMFQVPASNTWLEDAQAYNTEYRKGYSRILPAHREFSRLVMGAFSNAPVPTGDPPSDLDITSLGIVDPLIHPVHREGDVEIQVTDVTIGLELLTRQMMCAVWTFREQLNLQIFFNEAYHDVKEVQTILEWIKDTTLQELEVATKKVGA